MAVYRTRMFNGSTKKLGISEAALKKAACEVISGLFDADLGGGVIKKRVPLQLGKSGGARTIVFFRSGSHLFYFDGWAKSAVSGKGAKEIDDDELIAYKKFAAVYLGYGEAELSTLMTSGLLFEVNDEY
ncbi:type II toxin-antitoxin system RelE/ParE family toxin [Siccibacter colletis]|uniref:type II toxin-antitoxin system RelE/ParE family toxin n=1 Tax=Siccibacter colletis TaxID=1505757 RepID=UPI003CF823B0